MPTSNCFFVKQISILLVSAFAMGACSIHANEKHAALLPAESGQERAEIIALVSQSLGGKNIPIANDVFQHSSRLLLGKSAVTSPEGLEVFRANKGNALVFELVKQGDYCLLRRLDNAQEWQLTTKRCFKRQ